MKKIRLQTEELFFYGIREKKLVRGFFSDVTGTETCYFSVPAANNEKRKTVVSGLFIIAHKAITDSFKLGSKKRCCCLNHRLPFSISNRPMIINAQKEDELVF